MGVGELEAGELVDGENHTRWTSVRSKSRDELCRGGAGYRVTMVVIMTMLYMHGPVLRVHARSHTRRDFEATKKIFEKHQPTHVIHRESGFRDYTSRMCPFNHPPLVSLSWCIRVSRVGLIFVQRSIALPIDTHGRAFIVHRSPILP